MNKVGRDKQRIRNAIGKTITNNNTIFFVLGYGQLTQNLS